MPLDNPFFLLVLREYDSDRRDGANMFAFPRPFSWVLLQVECIVAVDAFSSTRETFYDSSHFFFSLSIFTLFLFSVLTIRRRRLLPPLPPSPSTTRWSNHRGLCKQHRFFLRISFFLYSFYPTTARAVKPSARLYVRWYIHIYIYI